MIFHDTQIDLQTQSGCPFICQELQFLVAGHPRNNRKSCKDNISKTDRKYIENVYKTYTRTLVYMKCIHFVYKTYIFRFGKNAIFVKYISGIDSIFTFFEKWKNNSNEKTIMPTCKDINILANGKNADHYDFFIDNEINMCMNINDIFEKV